MRYEILKRDHDFFGETISNTTVTNGCWIWNGSKTKGYPRRLKVINGKSFNIRLHRFVYSYIFGTTKLHILHKCNNPSCINPDHLYAGTHDENMRDKVRSGRVRYWDQIGKKGAECPSSKLTEDQIIAAMADIQKGLSRNEISLKHSIKLSNLSAIATGKSWGSITGIHYIKGVKK